MAHAACWHLRESWGLQGRHHSFRIMVWVFDIIVLGTVGGCSGGGRGVVRFCGMGDIQAFIAQLPKVELHVHLIGSAPEETVLELARRHPDRGVPRTAEGLREFYAFRDFPHFL